AALDPSRGPEGAGFATLLTLAVLGTAVVGIWTRGVDGQPLLAFSTTISGAVYTGALLSFGLFLRHLPGNTGSVHGTALLLAPVVLTWASDTCAYFAGRRWGTRKLIPSVSPGKTVQGAIGAVVGTVAAAIAYRYVLEPFPTYRLGLLEAVVVGLLISVAAQLGDLAESLFKRDAGMKDSGALLPGHGGALDRFDSLLFTLPLGYFFFRYLVGVPRPF
ncbi:MAG: CDP-archaeol synthase, partial [Gemmatimonadota bacterium]